MLFNNFSLNSKAQASVTDALFFLTIVISLVIFLFYFVSGFGYQIDSKLNEQYYKEYVNSAIKTIFYSSIPLQENKTLTSLKSDPNFTDEIDYLMAALKVDFFQDGNFDSTKLILSKNVRAIMRPLERSFDYLFYFYEVAPSRVVFALLHSSPSVDSVFDSTKYRFFYCNPESSSIVNNFLFGVPKTFSSTGITDFKLKEGNSITKKRLYIRLILWPSISLTDEKLNDLNCSPVKELKHVSS